MDPPNCSQKLAMCSTVCCFEKTPVEPTVESSPSKPKSPPKQPKQQGNSLPFVPSTPIEPKTILLDKEVDSLRETLACPKVECWDIQQVSFWLNFVGFSEFIPIFQQEEIDGEALVSLTPEDMTRLGLKIGHRTKLRAKLAEVPSYFTKKTSCEQKNIEPALGAEQDPCPLLAQVMDRLDKMQKRLDRISSVGWAANTEPKQTTPPDTFHSFVRDLSDCQKLLPLQPKEKEPPNVKPITPRPEESQSCALPENAYFDLTIPFASLPSCVHREIFSLLSPQTRLRRVALVCKFWRILTLDRRFWNTLDLTKHSSSSALQHVFRSFQHVGASVKYLKLPSFEKGYAKNYSVCEIKKNFPHLEVISVKDVIIKPQFFGQIHQAYPDLALEFSSDSGNRWFARQDDRATPECIPNISKVKNIQIEEFVLDSFLVKLRGLKELGIVLKFDTETPIWVKTLAYLKSKGNFIWPNLQRLSICSHNLRKIKMEGNVTISHKKLKHLALELYSGIGLVLDCPQLEVLFFTHADLISLPSTDPFENLNYLQINMFSCKGNLRFHGKMEYLDVFTPHAIVQLACPNLKKSRILSSDIILEEEQFGAQALVGCLGFNALDYEIPSNVTKLMARGVYLSQKHISRLSNLRVLHCVVSNKTDFSIFSNIPSLVELILTPTEKILEMTIRHSTLDCFGFGRMQHDGSSYPVAKCKFEFQKITRFLLEGAIPFQHSESFNTLQKLNLVSCCRFISTIPFFTSLTHLHVSIKRLDFLDIVSPSLQFLLIVKSNALTDVRVDCPNLRYFSVHRLSKVKSIQILHVSKLEGISIQYCKKLNTSFPDLFPKDTTFGPLKFFISQYSCLDFDFLTQLLPLLPERVHLLQLEGSPISLEMQEYLIKKYSFQLSRFEVVDKDILPEDHEFFPFHRFELYDLRKDGVIEDLVAWSFIFNAVGSQKKWGDKFGDRYMLKCPYINPQKKCSDYCWCKLRDDDLL